MNHPNYLNLPPQFPSDYAAAWGEDQYGLWFDLLIETVVQRFRWIPAGEFTMGSPEEEKEREGLGKETQHHVTLSQGYWLADTACTQALWQVVMGDNSADNLQAPVDSVSWLDIQTFLQRLNQQRPELQVQLPSEAQWEYACRAGTVTPFLLDETITSEQVNYNEKHSYAGVEKGEYREKAVLVNLWGVYEMQNNVWEWCQDEWSEDLGIAPVQDPVKVSIKLDGDSGDYRVLRGGSWDSSGRLCRSEFRRSHVANNRRRYYGFRFSLGH